MFVVATATFRLLYALIVLGHDRRRVIHVAVTQNPTQVWLSRQMTEDVGQFTAPDQIPGFGFYLTSEALDELLTLHPRLRPTNEHKQHDYLFAPKRSSQHVLAVSYDSFVTLCRRRWLIDAARQQLP